MYVARLTHPLKGNSVEVSGDVRLAHYNPHYNIKITVVLRGDNIHRLCNTMFFVAVVVVTLYCTRHSSSMYAKAGRE